MGHGEGSDALVWRDPFSADGLISADRIRPRSHDLRIAAESALVYVAQLRSEWQGPLLLKGVLHPAESRL